MRPETLSYLAPMGLDVETPKVEGNIPLPGDQIDLVLIVIGIAKVVAEVVIIAFLVDVLVG